MKKLFAIMTLSLLCINGCLCSSKSSDKKMTVVTVADVGGNPDGVTVADSGNIYITDIGNGDVKLIKPDGSVTTVANTGTDTHPDGITSVTTAAGKEILYVADTGSNDPEGESVSADGSVMKIDAETGAVTTLVDSSVIESPSGIAADKSGNLYVADQSGEVYLIPVDSSGNAGTPLNLTASLPSDVDIDNPHGLTLVNGDENSVILYVTDQGSADNNIVKIEVADPAGTPVVDITEFTAESTGGTETSTVASEAEMNTPHGLSLNENHEIIISDENNNRVQIITPAEEVITVAGDGIAGDTVGDTAAARFDQPRGLAVDADGNVLVCDYGNGKVKKIIPEEEIEVTTVAEVGGNPDGIAVADSGNLYVTDITNGEVKQVSPSGEVTVIADSDSVTLDHPDGVAAVTATDGRDILYVASTGSADPEGTTPSTDGTIQKIDVNTGAVTTFVDSTVIESPAGIAADSSGNLYVADQSSGDVFKIPVDANGNPGTPVNLTDTLPSGVDIEEPHGITVVTNSDNSITLTVTDQGANSNNIVQIELTSASDSTVTGIEELTPDNTGGSSTYTSTGRAKFNEPNSLSADKNGAIFVTDENNNKVQVIAPSGNVITIAGGKSAGDATGDAVDAKFSEPKGIAVDNNGDIIVCDSGNGKIKKIKQ